MLYYRKFGFEIGCFGKQCQYLLSMIPSFDMKDGYFVLVDESNRKQVLSDVKQLYGAWEVKYNGMIHNEGYEYAFVTESNPYKDQEFTYLYYRGNGQVILGITNSVLPQNNGSYWIRFTNGTLTAIERMPQDQVP